MTVIKCIEDNELYDVMYDEEYQKFIVWIRDEDILPECNGLHITCEQMKQYIDTKQIEVINDENNIIKNNAKNCNGI
jgi:hypothetical protein